MRTIVVTLVSLVREIIPSRATLQLENIALRQQAAVLKRQRPRPWLHPLDRVFRVFLSRPWPGWKDALVIVKPETVSGERDPPSQDIPHPLRAISQQAARIRHQVQRHRWNSEFEDGILSKIRKGPMHPTRHSFKNGFSRQV